MSTKCSISILEYIIIVYPTDLLPSLFFRDLLMTSIKNPFRLHIATVLPYCFQSITCGYFWSDLLPERILLLLSLSCTISIWRVEKRQVMVSLPNQLQNSLRADFTFHCERERAKAEFIYKFRLSSPSQWKVKSARRLAAK